MYVFDTAAAFTRIKERLVGGALSSANPTGIRIDRIVNRRFNSRHSVFRHGVRFRNGLPPSLGGVGEFGKVG